MATDAGLATAIEWGVAALPLPGEIATGDLHLITPTRDGVLVAVIDGLGHGEYAAAAARTVLTELQRHADEPIISLVQRAHVASRTTRGVALSLASLNTADGAMTWLGIGNVEGIVLRAEATTILPRERMLVRGGVVGYSLPTLRPSTLPMTRGDILIFATDGIRADFAEGLLPRGSAQQMADRILAESAKRTDDALVLVVRYLG